ncbi:putative membrane protein (plasmid) [Staphylococcus epidermidis]|nr:putative membrane protein [Staphylococcus epidermidis]
MIYKIYQFLIFITLSLITFLGHLNLLKITTSTIFIQLLIIFFIAYFYYKLAFDEDESSMSARSHIYEITLLILSITFTTYSFFLIK